MLSSIVMVLAQATTVILHTRQPVIALTPCWCVLSNEATNPNLI